MEKLLKYLVLACVSDWEFVTLVWCFLVATLAKFFVKQKYVKRGGNSDFEAPQFLQNLRYINGC